jgi:hypothetical protein
LKISSFDTAILEEPERFISYAISENPNIKDFGDFKSALDEGMKKPKGEITEATYINLFEHKNVKETIAENVDSKEYDKLYGDGNIVKREVVGKQVITITEPKVHTRGYVKNNKSVRAYDRGYKRWTNSEKLFIQTRVERKVTPSKIAQEYNMHFKSNPRTKSSLTSKISKSGKSFSNK